MADAPSFAKLVPGFDFLQGLVKNAGAALPSIGQWVAPTLNPEELEKRINELRTVQYWLEQNARMLAATIQALEVQRMTLSTLKTMNVQMEDLRDSLQIRMPGITSPARAAAPAEPPPAPKAAPAPAPAPAVEEAAAAPAPKAGARAASSKDKTAGTSGPVDPLQWWGALTKQFTELAANAMKETAGDAARSLAGGVMKKSIDAAADALKKSAAKPKASAKRAPARKRPAAKRAAPA